MFLLCISSPKMHSNQKQFQTDVFCSLTANVSFCFILSLDLLCSMYHHFKHNMCNQWGYYTAGDKQLTVIMIHV